MSTSVDIEFNLNNLNEVYELGKVAKQANGSVLLKSGNSVILATIVSELSNPVEEDFIPLTVQYIEKTYATGKFPGGFIKREAKPSDFETLTSRIIDRSLRPLFPKGFRYPTQITVMVLSTDEQADLQVLALNAASAALFTSDIPINTNVTALRVAKIEENIIINPSMKELENSSLDLFVAGTGDDLLMIEMKSNELGEDELLSILNTTKQAISKATVIYTEAFSKNSKEPSNIILVEDTLNSEIYNYIKETHTKEIKDAVTKMAKSERNSDLKIIAKNIDKLKENWDYSEIYKAVEQYKKEIVRALIINDKVRADGRALDEVRPISIETNILPQAHGSCLFTRGETQALVVATLGGDRDSQMFERVTSKNTFNENFMVHYNFPGFSVGEAKPMFAPGRRELGHGNLAKRALEATINLNEKDTVRLVSEVLESNGSSSMATICGGSLALKASRVASSKLVAGVAMGLVIEDNQHAVLTDIMGLEDHDGDMDFKVAGTQDGITALQMDIKLGGLDFDILKEALFQAKDARFHILDIMKEAEEKIVINEDALPALERFSINPSKVGAIIGKAGATIKEIIEKFGVSIDLERDSGTVTVKGEKLSKVKEAMEFIKVLSEKEDTREKKVSIKFDALYKVEDILSGKVVRVVDFGAFIELPKGGEGLIHISKLSEQRVQRVTDILNIDDTFDIKVIKVSHDRIELAHKEYNL